MIYTYDFAKRQVTDLSHLRVIMNLLLNAIDI